MNHKIYFMRREIESPSKLIVGFVVSPKAVLFFTGVCLLRGILYICIYTYIYIYIYDMYNHTHIHTYTDVYTHTYA